jgi:hypothetical protein
MTDYDNFTELKATFPDYIDYLYISDRETNLKTWKTKIINVEPETDPYLLAKMYKILPHRFFPDYDISIWLDASAINVQGPFHKLVEEFMFDFNFLICRHPSRCCVYEEALACIRSKKDQVDKIVKQINRYKP